MPGVVRDARGREAHNPDCWCDRCAVERADDRKRSFEAHILSTLIRIATTLERIELALKERGNDG
jgi:hypothetical protein